MDETSALLPDDNWESVEAQVHTEGPAGETDRIRHCTQRYLLPASIIVAFACTVTSATSVFAFAKLLCHGHLDCDTQEAAKFAKSIGIATSLGNIAGAFSLFPLEKLSRRGQKKGLLIWLLARSMSPICLLVGVLEKSITVALLSKVFESVASDNVFHFNQNAAFSLSGSRPLCDRLMALSFGFYMAGVSVGPFMGGLLRNISWSFILSFAFFGLAFVYVHHVVPDINSSGQPTEVGNSTPLQQIPPLRAAMQLIVQSRRSIWATLKPVCRSRRSLVLGSSLLMYNIGQSYAFESILISNTLRFKFDPLHNGIVISLAHISSAIYIFGLSLASREESNTAIPESIDNFTGLWLRNRRACFCICCLASYGSVLVSLGLVNQAFFVYIGSFLIAAGLAASYLLKAELIGSVAQKDGPSAAAFAAAVEIFAGVFAPLAVSRLQASWGPQTALISLGGIMFVSIAPLFLLLIV